MMNRFAVLGVIQSRFLDNANRQWAEWTESVTKWWTHLWDWGSWVWIRGRGKHFWPASNCYRPVWGWWAGGWRRNRRPRGWSGCSRGRSAPSSLAAAAPPPESSSTDCPWSRNGTDYRIIDIGTEDATWRFLNSQDSILKLTSIDLNEANHATIIWSVNTSSMQTSSNPVQDWLIEGRFDSHSIESMIKSSSRRSNSKGGWKLDNLEVEVLQRAFLALEGFGTDATDAAPRQLQVVDDHVLEDSIPQVDHAAVVHVQQVNRLSTNQFSLIMCCCRDQVSLILSNQTGPNLRILT